MAERVWIDDEGSVVLDDRSFVAAGGQGRVWARGARAYKLPDDPAQVVTPTQLHELARVTDPRWVAPERPIFAPDRRRRIGHTMRWVADAVPWAQLAVAAVRARHGIDRRRQLALVDALAEIVALAHAADIALGDLHGHNVLVVPATGALHLIDLDGARTPSHALAAQAVAIADPCPRPGAEHASDWFALAVLCCELLLGIHPFRGHHPTLASTAERIAARISVLDPSVRLPPCCERPASLPTALRAWLTAVLEHDVREPPPRLGPTAAMQRIPSPPALDPGWSTVLRLGEPIVGWACGPTAVTVIGRHEFATTAGLRGALPARTLGVMVLDDEPFALCGQATELALVDLARGTRWPLAIAAHDVHVHAGRVLGRSGDRLVEIDVRRLGARPIASVRPLATVSALATRIWPGCALWESLGALHVVLAPGGGRSLHCTLVGERGRVLAASACDDAFAVDLAHAGAIERVLVRVDATGQPRWVQRSPISAPGGVIWARAPQPDGTQIPRALDPQASAARTPAGLATASHDPSLAVAHGLTALVDAPGRLAVACDALVCWTAAWPAFGLAPSAGSTAIVASTSGRVGC